MLGNEVYIGNSIHYRQVGISYKNKKRVRQPPEEWMRVENTHEPIISKEKRAAVLTSLTSGQLSFKIRTWDISQT